MYVAENICETMAFVRPCYQRGVDYCRLFQHNVKSFTLSWKQGINTSLVTHNLNLDTSMHTHWLKEKLVITNSQTFNKQHVIDLYNEQSINGTRDELAPEEMNCQPGVQRKSKERRED